MFNSRKINKIILLSICGIALFFAGGNPTVQNALSVIKMPISYADGDKFNLHSKITHKQFSLVDHSNQDWHNNHSAHYPNYINKKVARKGNNYLSHVGNLNKYYVQTSFSDTTMTRNGDAEAMENIEFIRK